jgi:hypothetical protein
MAHREMTETSKSKVMQNMCGISILLRVPRTIDLSLQAEGLAAALHH